MALYLGFPISAALHIRVDESFRRVKEEPPEKAHTAFITETIIGMTDTGIEFYVAGLVSRMNLGKGADRIVPFAVKTVKAGLQLIIDRVGKGLSDEQFHPLVEFLVEILVQRAGQTYVVFPASPELEERLHDYMYRVREQPPATDHAWACHDLIVDFKHSALEFYFRESTDRLGVRGWARKTVNIGLDIADRASSKALKRVVPGLSEASLIDIADFYRGVMLEKNQ